MEGVSHRDGCGCGDLLQGADGLLAEWDPAIDKEGKATEVKLLYPSEVISKLPHSDTPLMYSTCALVSNSGSLLEVTAPPFTTARG